MSDQPAHDPAGSLGKPGGGISGAHAERDRDRSGSAAGPGPAGRDATGRPGERLEWASAGWTAARLTGTPA
jgi:hypothetical protein